MRFLLFCYCKNYQLQNGQRTVDEVGRAVESEGCVIFFVLFAFDFHYCFCVIFMCFLLLCYCKNYRLQNGQRTVDEAGRAVEPGGGALIVPG